MTKEAAMGLWGGECMYVVKHVFSPEEGRGGSILQHIRGKEVIVYCLSPQPPSDPPTLV